MKEYSSDMIATQIGVPQDAVETWAEEFQIPYRQRGVSRNFEQEALDVIKTIKNLKDCNRGYDTIRQKIEVSYPGLWNSPAPATGLPSIQALEKLIAETVERSLTQKWNDLISQLGNLNELAEQFAQASYTIGQMTEKARSLEETNYRLRAQLKLLPTPDEWQAVQEREKLYKKLLYDLHGRLERLEYGGSCSGETLRVQGLPPIGPEVMSAPVNPSPTPGEDVRVGHTDPGRRHSDIKFLPES